jgi:hypothetical protein
MRCLQALAARFLDLVEPGFSCHCFGNSLQV